ncbi:hypothetical protein D3C72_2419560 [compost metagenome]
MHLGDGIQWFVDQLEIDQEDADLCRAELIGKERPDAARRQDKHENQRDPEGEFRYHLAQLLGYFELDAVAVEFFLLGMQP